MKYLHKKGLEQTLYGLLGVVLFIFSTRQIFRHVNDLNQFLILLLFYFLLFISLMMFHRASRRQEAYLKGIDGEADVSDQLKEIDGIELIDDVTLPNLKGNIDHVAIYKGLIFCIETKNYSQLIQFRSGYAKIGHKMISSPALQAKRNAKALSDFAESYIGINVWVEPLVVLSNKKNVMQTNSSVTILSLDRLNEHLESISERKEAHSLDENAVEKVVKMLHQRD